MKINVGKLKNITGKIMDVELKETLSQLSVNEEDLKLLTPLEFVGQVKNLGDRLKVVGQIHTTVKLLCSRCMEVTSLEVNAPFSETFSNQKTVTEDGEEEISLFQGDEIDISAHIARAILLELPMKSLCKEECKGLCPECGINLNFEKCRCHEETIDPRFEALKNLVSSSSTEGGVENGSAKEKNI